MLLTLAGKACVVLTLGLIGVYDENGQCVVRVGPHYARPAEPFDIQHAPKDQNTSFPGFEK